MEALLREQLQALRERAELLTDENYHKESAVLNRIVSLVSSADASSDEVLLLVLRELTQFGDI